MIPALFAVDGRSLSAHVAVLVAHALVSDEVGVTLIRLVEPGQPRLFSDHRKGDRVHLVEIQTDRATASMRLDEALTAEQLGGRRVVLDLPGASLADPALRLRPGLLPVIPVGPAPLDASIVRASLGSGDFGPRPDRSAGEGTSDVRPWLLACGRSGGSSAVRDFFTSMNRGHHPTARLPVLPVALPVFTTSELASIVAGRPTAWPMKHGRGVVEAMLVAVGAAVLTPGAGNDVARPDDRDEVARLRDLADDLDAHRSQLAPSPERLDAAPLLEDWSWTVRTVPAMTGRVLGHPDIGTGRRTTTSEVYATDAKTYARTYSRFYRLGRPATAGRTS